MNNNQKFQNFIVKTQIFTLGMTILTVILIVLKMLHVISIKWLLVFSPILIQFLIGILVFIILISFAVIVNILIPTKKGDKK